MRLVSKTILLSLGSLFALISCTGQPTSSSLAQSQTSSIPEISSVAEESSVLISEEQTSSATQSSQSSSKPVSSSIEEEQEYFPLPETDSRWPVSFGEYGQTFRNRLASIIKTTGSKTVSYKGLNDVLSSSDKALQGSGVIPFYHSETTSTTDWNKEHVWPNSRGAGETGPGSDPQMIRPTKSSDNSSRGNKFYGDAQLDQAGNTWDPASFGYEEARGECARIIFYCATRYYDTCGTGGSSKGETALSLSNNPDDASGKHTMGRLDRLIEWNNQYPVTAQEIRRNNYLDNAGFARNPFIDHPEYANWIWSKNGLRTKPVITDVSSFESVSSVSYKYNYDPISSVADLTGKIGIAGRENSSSTYFAMTGDAKSPTLPYYILGKELVYDNNRFSINSENVAYFTFTKLDNGNYTIACGSSYLYNYIDGTHYSIGYDATDKDGASKEWTVTVSSNGKAEIVGTNGVHLEYYNTSFCGYKYSPKESLVLFK